MSLFHRLKVTRPLGSRVPDDKSIGDWLKKEAFPLVGMVRQIVNWLCDYIGYVAVDTTDTPGTLEDKIVDSATVTWTKNGADGAHTYSAAVDFLGLVRVDTTDTPGTLEDKIVDSATVTWTKNGADGAHTYSAAASPTPFTLPDPAAESSNLYPAKVPDPLNLGDVTCVFGEHGCTEYHTFSSGPWTQSGDTFTRPVAGPLPSSWLDGLDPTVWDSDGYSTLVGAIVICPPADDLLVADRKTWGAFEILDTGLHMQGAVPVYSYATLRRIATLNTSDDFVQGITFHVLQGNVFGGMYATLQNAFVNLGIDEQNWHFVGPGAPPTWNDACELLTAAEVVTRGASADALDLSASVAAGSSLMVTATGETSFSTVGFLPDTLPAGKVDFVLKDVVLSGSKGNGFSNRITCNLYDDDGAGTLVLLASATTQHIDWSTLYSQSSRTLTCQGFIANPYPRTPGHVLTVRYTFATDSSTAVACSFTYNSLDRTTKVGVTWESAAVGGTTWHPDLLGRDQPNQHPWSSIEPVGLAKIPLPTATLTLASSGGSNGKLAMPAGNVCLVDPAGLSLTQIQTPSITAGSTVVLTLIFTAPILVVPGVSPDAGHTTLWLAHDPSITGMEYPNEYASMKLIYIPTLSAWVRLEDSET